MTNKEEEVDTLIAKIYDNEQKIFDLDNQKRLIEFELRELKKKLFYTCEHDWVRDWDAPFDCHSKWMCGKCKMSRNEYMYR